MLGKEIIITGAQSRAIPQSAMNLGTMAIKQLEYILAVQPDVVLLCVNFLCSLKPQFHFCELPIFLYHLFQKKYPINEQNF